MNTLGPGNDRLDPAARKMAAGIGRAGKRKEEYRRQGDRAFWSSLAFIGMVGWGVALPSLMAALLGVWLEKKFGLGIRWTLSLLVAGVGLGCWNAWHAINQDRE